MIRLLVENHIDGRRYTLDETERVIAIGECHEGHALRRGVRARCRIHIMGVDCAVCTLAILTLPRTGHVCGKLKNEFLSRVNLAETEGAGARVDRNNFTEIGIRW